MKKYIVVLVLLSGLLFAQEKDSTLSKEDSTASKWDPSLVAGFNLSQIAFSNWSQGGENSITWTVVGNFGLKYKTETWGLKNELKAAYGRTKQGGGDFITNDNELYFESVLTYNVGWTVDPFLSNTVRTQLTAGYKYTDTSVTQISDFFDPGYLSQSIGFTFNSEKVIQTRLGIAVQEIITNHFRRYSDDSKTPNKLEAFKFESGIESATDVKYYIHFNVVYISKLRLFSRFEKFHVWDVRWDNTLNAKIISWLNVNLTYLLVYQKDQSPTAQMKQALQLGIVYTIF